MPIKKTHEQFLKDIKKVNENIIVLGMYVNGKTPILCKCKKKKCTRETDWSSENYHENNDEKQKSVQVTTQWLVWQ